MPTGSQDMRKNEFRKLSALVELTDAELDTVVGADKGGKPHWSSFFTTITITADSFNGVNNNQNNQNTGISSGQSNNFG